MPKNHTRIIILGAGYAGIRVARDLIRAKKRGAAITITLLTDRPQHIDTPALYEVATAYLHRESVASSEAIGAGVEVALEEIFANQPIELLVRTVRDILPQERLVECSDNTTISYDILVVTLGATLATHGVPGVKEYAFSVKTITEALELRHHIVRQFMMAKKMPAAQRGNNLSFAVIGAGATGVELAAELCGQIQKLCQRHQIDATCPRVFLIEGQSEILSTIPQPQRAYALARLAQVGVEVKTGRTITSVQPDGVVFADGELLPAATVVWTSGLKVHPVLVGAQLPLASWGIACTPTLQVLGQPDIFVAGDAAILPAAGTKIPGVAPVAYAQGSLVASNIMRSIHGQALLPYHYRSVGALITLGGKTAVAAGLGIQGLNGPAAWFLKKIVALHYWLSVLSVPRAISFWRHGIRLQSLND